MKKKSKDGLVAWKTKQAAIMSMNQTKDQHGTITLQDGMGTHTLAITNSSLFGLKSLLQGENLQLLIY